MSALITAHFKLQVHFCRPSVGEQTRVDHLTDIPGQAEDPVGLRSGHAGACGLAEDVQCREKRCVYRRTTEYLMIYC